MAGLTFLSLDDRNTVELNGIYFKESPDFYSGGKVFLSHLNWDLNPVEDLAGDTVRFKLYIDRFSPVTLCFRKLNGAWNLPEGDCTLGVGLMRMCTSEKPTAFLRAGGRCCVNWAMLYFPLEIPEPLLWHKPLTRPPAGLTRPPVLPHPLHAAGHGFVSKSVTFSRRWRLALLSSRPVRCTTGAQLRAACEPARPRPCADRSPSSRPGPGQTPRADALRGGS